MFAWWNALDTIHQIFYIIAIPSTIVLVLQTILLLFGYGHGGDSDVDHDLDFDHDAAGLDHDLDVDHDFDAGGHDADGGHDGGAEHTTGLRLLTVRGIVAFLAVSGWVGIALLDLGLSSGLSIFIALWCGLAALVLVAVILHFSMKLQQSGNLDLQNAVGVTGEVYVPIPAGGKGKVTLVVQERFMELDAMCPDAALKTGQQVVVTDVTDTNTLIVSPLA